MIALHLKLPISKFISKLSSSKFRREFRFQNPAKLTLCGSVFFASRLIIRVIVIESVMIGYHGEESILIEIAMHMNMPMYEMHCASLNL